MQKTVILILAVLLTAIEASWSQSLEPAVVWEDAYGGMKDDWATDVLLTTDGNVVVVGTTYSFGAGSSDVYLLKTDTKGTLIWDTTFGATTYEYGNAFQLTSDNGLIIAGFKSHEPSINHAKLLLIKADSGGNEVWAKDFAYDTGMSANSVVEVLDGGYVAVGSCHRSNDSKVGLLRTDSAGNKVWLKVYDSLLSYSEYATHVGPTPDGGFVLCGRESNNTGRGFLLKTDTNNDVQWREIYFNGSHDLKFTCVRFTTDGNYIVSGYTHWNYHYDGYIAKIDQEGNMLWSREYDLQGLDEFFSSIIEMGNGEYAICGYLREPYKALCLKINAFGNVVWKKILNNATTARAIVEADDRTFYLAGNTDSFGAGNQDVYLAKIQEPIVSAPLLYAEPNELTFVSAIDENGPDTQSVGIYNQGVGTLNWHVQEDCAWLDVYPASGVSTGDTNEILISIDKTNLDIGRYTYDLQVFDANAENSPYTIKVVLIIHNHTLSVPDDFDTIQQAIDAAEDGDTIVIAPGRYTGPGNRDIEIIDKAITIRGADPNDPDIVRATIIDCNGVQDDPHGAFYFRNKEDKNSVLAGLTVTNAFTYYYGAVECDWGNLTIRSCCITSNRSRGIYCWSGSFLIADCVIRNNSRGGIACYGYRNRAKIVGSTIVGNSHGAGVDADDVDIIDCVIMDNANCTGRIYGAGGIAAYDANIVNCVVSDNTNTNRFGAGGISIASGTIANCIVSGNRSLVRGSGGIHCEGRWGSGACRIAGCIVSGNTGDQGGGFSFSNGRGGTSMIANCTVIGNAASSDGGAIYAQRYRGNLAIENCIIWANHAEHVPQVCLAGGWERSLQIDCSDIQGGPNDVHIGDGWTVNSNDGNIDADPCFVEPGYWADATDPNIVVEPNDPNAMWVHGDYHLLPGSPCINAGDPNYVAGPDESDMDGQPRVWDGRVDMGADEFVPPVECRMRLTPRVLNLGSRGRWVKAHLLLPEGFAVSDVDTNTPIVIEPLGIESHYINVFLDKDCLVEIKAGFERAAFCSHGPFDGSITVEGSLTTGQPFYGTATIKVIDKSLEQIASLASYWLRADCGAPAWCSGLDVNRDSAVNFADFALFDGCCMEIIAQ